MKFAVQDAAKSRRGSRPESIILFSVAHQMFAIAADSVQEIRSADSLAGAAHEIERPEIPKVRHTIERSHRTYYVVNAGAHFGLPTTRPALVLILRQLRVAVLVDRIERMTEISAV
ncbi:MAG: chemotaxis protein CheW, partial [Candidatus Acidiferrales bacterium]